ncbi:MAG: lipid-binding SYLF domain-containing protein [Halioglobus sp.]|jgi:lipid-binding SYLF domain-containing protein
MIRKVQIFLLLLVVSGLAAPTWADKYSEAMDSFQNAGESAAYFEGAYGYAIFPTIGKGGIGLGGAHGQGQVYAQGALLGTSSMSQVTIGFQLGAQAFSQIVFFEDERALNEFTSGNFEFSAQATAVAITAGVSVTANTGGGASAGVSGGSNNASTVSAGYRKGMAIFTIAKGGLMYEAVLGGQKYSYTKS